LKHFLIGSILYLTNNICQRKDQKDEAIQRGQNRSKFEMIADSKSTLSLLAAMGSAWYNIRKDLYLGPLSAYWVKVIAASRSFTFQKNWTPFQVVVVVLYFCSKESSANLFVAFRRTQTNSFGSLLDGIASTAAKFLNVRQHLYLDLGCGHLRRGFSWEQFPLFHSTRWKRALSESR